MRQRKRGRRGTLPAAGQRSAAWLACPGNLPTVLLPYCIPESQLTAPHLNSPSCTVDTVFPCARLFTQLHLDGADVVQRPLSSAMHTRTSCRQTHIIAQHQQGSPTVQYNEQLKALWL